ncbi:hypothetical protein AVEN_161381-1, partial [Araneus ventricosus]
NPTKYDRQEEKVCNESSASGKTERKSCGMFVSPLFGLHSPVDSLPCEENFMRGNRSEDAPPQTDGRYSPEEEEDEGLIGF